MILCVYRNIVFARREIGADGEEGIYFSGAFK